MSFLGHNQYEFDMSGEHPDNLVIEEPLEIDPDSGTKIVVPNYGPCYAKGFKLTLPNGQLLTKEVDYQFYSLMGELTEYTGKGVVGIIEILRPNTNKVLATYQTLGDTSFWDSSLIKMIINAATDNRPVYWENLHDKPLGFPSAVHGESFIYQLTSFTEFVNFINDFTQSITDQPHLVDVKVDHLAALIDSTINRYKLMLQDLVNAHSGAYNAHGLTKASIGLGNVDNFKTATINQARIGESNRLHLTPPGLKEIINEFGYDQSRLLENNSLPISMYGNRNFIPPSIDGSYEAVGVTTNRAGFCIEEDGSLAVLAPRFDGKTAGLYFSQVVNFTDPATIKYNYTAVRYDHVRLKNDGVIAKSIMGGSDFNAMIIGDDTSNNMYVTLTKGTFNPAKHELKKIDVSNAGLPRTIGVLTYSNIAYLGDRIAVMMNLSRTVGSNTESFGTIKMFYIDINDIENLSMQTVPLRDWIINYTMPDGKVVTGSQYLDLSPMSVDPDNPGKLKQLYYTFPESLSASGGGYRSANVISTINPDDDTESIINVNRSFYFTYRDSNNVLRSHGATSNEVIWKRVGDTFSLLDCTPITDMNLGNLGFTLQPTANERTSAFINQCSSMLSNGWRATCRSGNEDYGCNNAMFTERSNKTPWGWLSKCSYTANHTINRIGSKETFNPPMKRGIKPLELTWTRDGYEVTHLKSQNGAATKTKVKLHDTNATANLPFFNWEVRPEVNLKENLMSLPIPTTDQETEIADSFVRPNSNITGDSAFLSSVSAGYGLNIKGNWGENRSVGGLYAFDPALIAGTDDGVLLYDSAGDLLYYPSTIVNQLKGLVEGAGVHPVKGVSICDLTANVNKNSGYSGSWNPNLSIVVVTYGKYVPSAPSKFGRMFVIRPVISNNTGNLYNPNYPRIVTGFTILDSTPERQFSNTEARMTETTWELSSVGPSGSQRRMFQAYVAGNLMDFAFETMMYSVVTGDGLTNSFLGRIDLSTGLLESYDHYALGPAWNTNAKLAVPRVGLMTTSNSPVDYGGCALLASFNSVTYCLYNTYLKDGWFVYIAECDVVFNGIKVHIPATVIDVRTVDPNYLNQRFYIYVYWDGRRPAYFYLSKLKFAESVWQMWVGTVDTDASGIKTITRQNVLSLNGVRIGTDRGGSTIMGSLGSVNSFGSIPWFSRDDIV